VPILPDSSLKRAEGSPSKPHTPQDFNYRRTLSSRLQPIFSVNGTHDIRYNPV
jgi:hypothetical protein